MKTPAPGPQRAQQLLAAQIDGSFNSDNGAYIIASLVWVGAFVQAFILYGAAPTERLLLWVSLVSLAQLGSFILIAAYRLRPPPAHQIARWGVYKIVQTSLLSLAWGSGVILLHVPGNIVTLLVPAMSAVAVTVASTTSNASYPPGMYPLLLGNTLPGAVYLLLFAQGGPDEKAVGYALIALLAVVITVGRVTASALRNATLARMDLADAAEQERRLRLETEQARNEADAARAHTARFFSAASHDLRQPLHALGLYSGLLRADPGPAERQSLLESVDSCVDSLERLFNGILGISEAELLQSQLRTQPVAVQPLVDKVLLRCRPLAEAKGLELRAVRSSLWVKTDAAALDRILSNLVINAIRYTEHGRVVVGVRRCGQICRLVVADSGIGIAAEHQASIFSELYQVGNPERDRRKGFGLGLAIVRRLCEALGSRIILHSEPGRGSQFAVSLERTLPQRADEPVLTLDATTQGLHVLLVEDDELVRDAMLRTLYEWQVPAHACADGAVALQILLAHPHRHWHVLVDYRLADGENGLSVVDQIRANCRPVPMTTMLTGEADAALAEGAARRGIDVLSKPLKPLRLRTILMAPGAPRTPDMPQ